MNFDHIDQFINCYYPELSLNELKKSFNYLHEQYLGSFPKINKEIDALCYLLYRSPATVGVLHRVLELINRQYPEIKISSCIDMGAGPMGVSLALTNYVKKIDVVEKNPLFVSLGSKLLEHTKPMAEVQVHQADMTRMQEFPSADLALFSYSIGEVEERQRLTVVKKVFNNTNYLLLIEPGTPKGYHNLMALRDQIEGTLLAPCPGNGPCPLKGKWCHFSTRISRSSLHRKIKQADLGYEDENFFYLFFSKEHFFKSGMRLLSRPRRTKLGVSVEVCAEDGIEMKNVNKKSNLYKSILKSTWGDIL